MVTKVWIATVCLLLILSSVGASAAEERNDRSEESAEIDSLPQKETSDSGEDRFYVYYFHGNRRCVTCRKLEAYAQEALETGFQQEMADSLLIWQPTNYDEKENKHYLEDYQLYTKALIISRTYEGEEIGWVNLDKIWQLVGDKDKYIEYVQKETRRFIEGETTDE